MANELAWAAAHLNKYRPSYTQYSDFYKGNHSPYVRDYWYYHAQESPYSQWMVQVKDNLCPSVIDSFADRLQIAGIASDNETAQAFIDELWKTNRMDTRAGYAHSQAIKLGDAYLTVWADQNKSVRVYTERTDSIAVRYGQTETGETIVEAVKTWCDESGRLRLTRYLPDQTERYISKVPSSLVPDDLSDMEPYNLNGQSVVPNPHGRVPIFHLSNSQDPDSFAQSELRDAIPLQIALDSSLRSMLSGEEYHAFPIRYMIGVQQRIDPTTGEPQKIHLEPSSILQLPSADSKVGLLDPADLSQFLKVQDSFRVEIARVTRTPVHLLTLNDGSFPSGEALKTAEAPLNAKVKDRQVAFGDVWEDVASFACTLAGIDPGYIECSWVNTEARSEKNSWATAVNKLEVGVSKHQILREAGYSDAEIERMMEENAENANTIGDKLLQSFNAGTTTG